MINANYLYFLIESSEQFDDDDIDCAISFLCNGTIEGRFYLGSITNDKGEVLMSEKELLKHL